MHHAGSQPHEGECSLLVLFEQRWLAVFSPMVFRWWSIILFWIALEMDDIDHVSMHYRTQESEERKIISIVSWIISTY